MHVRFPEAGNAAVAVVFAASPAAITRGLSGQAFLPEDSGMLFLFDDRADHAFWMKDVRFPLDMIFMGGGRVVGIVENAQPGDLTLRRSGRLSSAVLEVGGGWARAHGVRVGQRAVLPMNNMTTTARTRWHAGLAQTPADVQTNLQCPPPGFQWGQFAIVAPIAFFLGMGLAYALHIGGSQRRR